MKLKGIALRAARGALAGATQGPAAGIAAAARGRAPTPAEIVREALEDESVQQDLVALVVEIVSSMDAPSNAEGPAAGDGVQSAPPREWPHSILYLPTVEERIEASEGKNRKVHLVENKRHVGIGHNCETDPDMADLPVGHEITEERCAELFEDDLDDARDRALRGCARNGIELRQLPEAVQSGLVNLFFQLGNKPGRWGAMFRHIGAGDYAEAARESLRSGLVQGKPSGWWLQTPNRAVVVAPMLSDRALWFETGPETAFADGTRGPSVIEHPWQA